MVETSVPLSATHHGDVADAVRPQALTRCGSVTGAAPATFDTSGWTAYAFSAAGNVGAAGTPISRTIATGSEKCRSQASFMKSLHFSLCTSGTGGNGSRLYANKTPSAAAVRRSPSASAVVGRQSPSRAAFVGFTQARNTSAGRAGAWRTLDGGPRIMLNAETSSFTLVAMPVPMLKMPACVPASAASTASTTSATYTKSPS